MCRLLIRLLQLTVLGLPLSELTQDITDSHACATAPQGISEDPVA